MKRQVIALRGPGNSGKSTTLGILKTLIDGNPQFTKTFDKTNGNEFIAVYQTDHIKVGLTSTGDSYDYVVWRLQEMVDQGCNILICACRTFDRNKGTNSAVHEFGKVTYIEKTNSPFRTEHAIANKSDALTLRGKLLETIMEYQE